MFNFKYSLWYYTVFFSSWRKKLEKKQLSSRNEKWKGDFFFKSIDQCQFGNVKWEGSVAAHGQSKWTENLD